MRNQARCIEPGCDRTNHARRYCQWHYQAHRRDGTLDKVNQMGVYATEPGGAICGVCGRNIYNHGVTEWCYIEERQAHHARR